MKCWNPECANVALAETAVWCPDCKQERPYALTAPTPPRAESKLPECPDCGEPRQQPFTFCRGCGYSYIELPSGWDPYFRRCAYVDRGQRCARLGTISNNTLEYGPTGKGPPSARWCREHAR